jgi:hypothetical protein
MSEFFFNYYLLPFHSVVALIILSMAETIGIYIGIRPSQLFRKFLQIGLCIHHCLMLSFLKF